MESDLDSLSLAWDLPETVKMILSRLSENGFSCYVVGGATRDAVYHHLTGGIVEMPPQDFDILTRASLKEVEKLFQDQAVKIAGKTFPVCLVNGIEISTCRNESGPASFPESDLAHRDFTINAMAVDPKTGLLIDLFGGQKSLERKEIVFTKDPEKRIKEDPLRMIRACRFSALLNGCITPESLSAIKKFKTLIKTVATERIQAELIKAMGLKRPSLFFKAMQHTGLLKDTLPSLDRCFGLDGGPFHSETVFEHCMLVGDDLPASRPVLRLAGYLHDASKYDAMGNKDGRITFAGHENHTKAVLSDLKHLRFSQQDIDFILAILTSHMRPLTEKTTPRAARRLLSMLNEKGLDYTDFMRVRIADKKGNLKKAPYTLDQIRKRLKVLYNELGPNSALDINKIQISGTQIMDILGLSPGPDVGKIKQMLFEKVLDNPDLNTRDTLIKLCQSLKIEK